MSRISEKIKSLQTPVSVLSAALLVVAGPVMAHSPPNANGAPEGITRATIMSEGGVSGISAIVLDAPQPALMIRYHGEKPLIIYDGENKPFLRFTRTSVEAHTQSAGWLKLPQSQGREIREEAQWVEVSASGNFGWVDARLSLPEGHSPGRTAQWRIPVQQGEEKPSAITGHLNWVPIRVGSDHSM